MQARKYMQLIYSIYHGNETHEIFLIAMLATSTVAFLLNVSRSTSLRIKVALVEIYPYHLDNFDDIKKYIVRIEVNIADFKNRHWYVILQALVLLDWMDS